MYQYIGKKFTGQYIGYRKRMVSEMNTTQLIRQLCQKYFASLDVGVNVKGQIYARLVGDKCVITGTGDDLDAALADVVSTIKRLEAASK